MDRWRANRWRIETSMEEIEGEVEKESENQRKVEYRTKEQQNKLYRGQEQECYL